MGGLLGNLRNRAGVLWLVCGADSPASELAGGQRRQRPRRCTTRTTAGARRGWGETLDVKTDHA